MTCQQPRWREMIIDRLANELSEEDAILLEQHLAECPDCAQEERTLATLLQKAVPRHEWVPNPQLEARLLASLRAKVAKDSANGSWIQRALVRLSALIRHPLPAYTTVSFVLMALIAGVWMGSAGIPQGQREPADELGWTTPGRTSALEGPILWGEELLGANSGFEVTPCDAVSPVWAIEPDSL